MQVQEEGGTQQVTETSGASVEKDTKLVPKEELDHVLKDMHRYKSEARALQERASKADQLEARLQAIEAEKLKSQNMHKELAEKLEKENNLLKEERAREKKAFIETKKFDALRLAAQKAGIVDESDLDLVPLDDIQVEVTNTGKMSVSGADDFVSNVLKKTKPHWFKSSDSLKVNTGGAGNNTVEDSLDIKEISKITDPKKYKEQLAKYLKTKK